MEFSGFSQQRLYDLNDNLEKDYQLIKDFEDKLRYEGDPRTLKKLESDIERQRKVINVYYPEFMNLNQEAKNYTQSRILAFLEDDEFKSFYGILEQLLQTLKSGHYSPLILLIFIDIIQKMGFDLQNGASLQDLLDRVISGTYLTFEGNMSEYYKQRKSKIFDYMFELHLQEKKIVNLSVFLLIMNKTEAEELFSLRAFDEYSRKDSSNFQDFIGRLEKSSKQWRESYRDLSEEWQPFEGADQSTSIRQLVLQTFQPIRETWLSKYGKELDLVVLKL